MPSFDELLVPYLWLIVCVMKYGRTETATRKTERVLLARLCRSRQSGLA
jgi:hypothetical protein